MEYNIPQQLKGLSESEVFLAQKEFGANQITNNESRSMVMLLWNIIKEPMLILLIATVIIYLIVGEYGDAAFMFFALIAVSGISLYQDNRSKKALKELEKLNEPLSTVIRNGEARKILTHEIVVGDLCIAEEGKMINADGTIVHSNDFSVNESSLTGESYSIFKDSQSSNNKVYSGTIAVSGLAIFSVTKIGKETQLGKIGSSLIKIKEERSPLQIQIEHFVKVMAVIGFIIFSLVCITAYIENHNIITSLLSGLTLAMSILPEEIPVAFTTFMALGSWRLMREGIIIKRSSIVETLGSTTVVCSDKTGTITQNTMKLNHLYDYGSLSVYNADRFNDSKLNELISYAMWGSEPVPFNPMEISIHDIYEKTQNKDLRKEYNLFHEYPLSGTPPMMTHLFENERKERIIAAKGAPEAILDVSTLPKIEKDKIRDIILDFGKRGFRILGVAKATFEGDLFPKQQQDFSFFFLGLLIFYDPPKEGISEVFKQIYDAGIKVKIITGDNLETTRAIAKQAGIRHTDAAIKGIDITGKTDNELSIIAENTVLFTRMFPEAKLTIVNTLKRNGEVVAMLGDGVNDGPALKAAHIGVAMGHKGTEIAKAAAALVITNDNLEKLITGIAAGRRIYSNIKKAIQYIISIHIPIILTVSLPLFLGWIYPQIFSPAHVIFLELVMGPTCSIAYEREPMDKNAMQQPPRLITETFLNWKEMAISIIQGLAITVGVLLVYQLAVYNGGNEEKTRAMVFSTMLFANIFLSYTNRSFYHSIFETLKNPNALLTGITVTVLILLLIILYVAPVSDFFHVTGLHIIELFTTMVIGAASVLWFEIYKFRKRKMLHLP